MRLQNQSFAVRGCVSANPKVPQLRHVVLTQVNKNKFDTICKIYTFPQIENHICDTCDCFDPFCLSAKIVDELSTYPYSENVYYKGYKHW